MNGWSGVEFSIGLRHVLEDSLVLLHGGQLDPQRRDLVLGNLGNFMNRARKGSAAARADEFVGTTGTTEAVEAYGLLFHLLKGSFGSGLSVEIEKVADVLDGLRSKKDVPREGYASAERLI